MPVCNPIENYLGLLHRIASAYPGTERENAKQELDEFLASSSREDACTLSEQLPDILPCLIFLMARQ